jgi:hypothetical protein
MSDYPAFPKMPRLRRNCVVSEKIDGSNGLIFIEPFDVQSPTLATHAMVGVHPDTGEPSFIYAGSRSRWLRPVKNEDNFGFAAWVNANADELVKLGPGHHYGEWWGQGIQRTYGLKEKKFSLFNSKRWADPAVRPACTDVVPILYEGIFEDAAVSTALLNLEIYGSKAALGFFDPEGIVVWHEASKQSFKVTCKNDERAKGNEG